MTKNSSFNFGDLAQNYFPARGACAQGEKA